METPRGRRLRLLAIAALLSCKGSEDQAQEEPAPSQAEPAKPIEDGAPPGEEVASGPASMLAWLDPEAVTVMWVDLPEDVDSDVLANVFAMPPKIARMLRDARGV